MLNKLKTFFSGAKKEVKEKAEELYTRFVEKKEDESKFIKTYPSIKIGMVEWVTPNTDLRKKLEQKGIKAPQKKCLRLATLDESKKRTFKVINSDGSFHEVETTSWIKWADQSAVDKDRELLLALL